MNKFRVKVLIATHNGMPWLADQLDSIRAQVSLDLEIYVSDDISSDTTFHYLTQVAKKDSRVRLLTPKKIGSAGQNFYRLMQETVFDNTCNYVAFADQDDIWEKDKLIRHINIAELMQADGVSSNANAFWPNGKKLLINKSQAQKKWDFLFESAGPGCTFLMSAKLANKIKDNLNDDFSSAKNCALHDWLSYAVCRALNWKWVIDDLPTVNYRQHAYNVLGANIGLKAGYNRWLRLKNGWYRKEVINICKVCMSLSQDKQLNEIYNLLINKTFLNQLKLLKYTFDFRRKLSDRLLLFFLILTFGF